MGAKVAWAATIPTSKETMIQFLAACVFIMSSFNSFTNTITVETTTPIKWFRILNASDSYSTPIIQENKASFVLYIRDPKHWSAEYQLQDNCKTWNDYMRTT